MLEEKLRKAFDIISSKQFVDKDAVKLAVKEIQRALIASDMDVSLVLNLTKQIEEESFAKLPEGVNRKDFILKLAFDKLSSILGKHEKKDLLKPKRILLVGLFGSGKTTTTAKLARYYKNHGFKPLVIAADTFRKAAYEQLEQLSSELEISFYGNTSEKNAVEIVKSSLKKFNEYKDFRPVIVDSAGRNALDEELAKEITEIKKTFNPEEIWLVLPADIGSTAKTQAEKFHELFGVTGVIISKTDGSGKAGASLAACATTNSKVLFIGTGEKLEDLEEFDSDRFLTRLLGYPDLQAIMEKTQKLISQENFNPEEILSQDFTLDAFYKQISAMQNLGSLGKITEMFGLKQQISKEQVQFTETKLNSFKTAMNSMTKQEKSNPELISSGRIKRIAKGSGQPEQSIRELLSNYKKTKKMFGQARKLDLGNMQNDPKSMEKLMEKMSRKKQRKLRLR